LLIVQSAANKRALYRINKKLHIQSARLRGRFDKILIIFQIAPVKIKNRRKVYYLQKEYL